MKILRSFILIYSLACILTSVKSQSIATPSPIQLLKEGVLVVRLDMKNTTIEAYEKMLTSSSLTTKDKKDIENKISELKMERLLYKKNVSEAFNSNYHFSDIAFVESQFFKSFITGDLSNVEATHETVNKISTTQNLFYLIQDGSEGKWAIVNKSFKKPNFPNTFTLGFKSVVNFILGRKSYSLENQLRLAEKVNTKLNNYFYKR